MDNNFFDIFDNYDISDILGTCEPTEICTCCKLPLTENDTVYKIDGSFLCRECTDKFGGIPVSYGEYLVVDGVPRVIANPEKSNHVPQGINKINLAYKDPIVIEEIQSGDINDSISHNYAVAEARRQGVAVLFSRDLIAPKVTFDFWKKEYKNIRTLTYAPSGVKAKYLCDGNNVIGAVQMRAPSVNLKEIMIYKDGMQLYTDEEMRELQKNPPIPLGVSHALRNITPTDMLEYFEERLIGQSSETKKIVYTFYEYFKCAANDKPFHASNWVLTAPSGCGKTEVFRILRDFCKENNIPIPVVQFDMSHFTEAGYKGKELTEIVELILDEDKKTDGIQFYCPNYRTPIDVNALKIYLITNRSTITYING